MGMISIPLFVLMIVDALTMLKFEDKTIKRPSFILSKIWDFIDMFKRQKKEPTLYRQEESSLLSSFDNITSYFSNIGKKIKNLFNNLEEEKVNDKKYDTERKLNKFSDEIGEKITIEYTSPDKKLKKKTFEYKDRAITYIKMLESNGYKNYTKYNLNADTSSTYIILNKNKDIVDIEKNRIQLKHDDPDYKYVIRGWPKK